MGRLEAGSNWGNPSCIEVCLNGVPWPLIFSLNLSHKLSLWHIDTAQLECVHWQHVLGRRFVLRSQMEKVMSNSVLSGPLPSCPVTQLFLSLSIYVLPGTGRQQVSHMLWLDYSFHLPQQHDTLRWSYPAGC